MHRSLLLSLLLPILSIPGIAEETILLKGDNFRAGFSAENGGLVYLYQKWGRARIIASGEDGLWSVRFRDGQVLRASEFGRWAERRNFHVEALDGNRSIRMAYSAPEAIVHITVEATDNGLELKGEMTGGTKTVLDFALPGRLRFDPQMTKQVVAPMNGNYSVGTAFEKQFFLRQSEEKPSGWRPEVSGPKGYIAVFGAPLDQRPDRESPVALRIGADAEDWLSEETRKVILRTLTVVNRPGTRGQVDLVLVDSVRGPFFGASRLGGSGGLWRVGGAVRKTEISLATRLIKDVAQRLPENKSERAIVALIDLANGPRQGGWAEVAVESWEEILKELPGVRRGDLEFKVLRSTPALAAALTGSDTLAILNPYGEWLPQLPGETLEGTASAVGDFVRGGGHWFEVGGYSFYSALRPVLYYIYSTPYPGGFADFLHLESSSGSVAVYGVQPRSWQPWSAATNSKHIFIPGVVGCGADERGGYLERKFATFVRPGQTWSSPNVRLDVGVGAMESLWAYRKANAFNRRLVQKMKPELLERFRKSVLIKYNGSARDMLKNLHRLPSPSLVHFTNYLKGGFDKEYPDHLPPHPVFGSSDDLGELVLRCRQLGLLVMPYTNPTWWCTEPKGPTFESEGEAPLLRTLEGKLSPEQYGAAANRGYTICHWHPAVRSANHKTLTQFSEEFPMDILFQDQCAVRRWRYDTNPASPAPFAYYEGILSMIDEDSDGIPISTEGGFDQAINAESQFCGMGFGIVPTHDRRPRTLMKYVYPPDTWKVYPLAQILAHDRLAMNYHNLGHFVVRRDILAWTLGLGFGMNAIITAKDLEAPARRQWLLWLDRIQKSVVARYLGEPLQHFEHRRGPRPSVEDDGVIESAYGQVELLVNLGPKSRKLESQWLAPHGFFARAPGMVAGNLSRIGREQFLPPGASFICESNHDEMEVWVYGPAEQLTAVLLPERKSGNGMVKWDGAIEQKVRVRRGILSLRLPQNPANERIRIPDSLVDRPPLEWGKRPPAIGVLDFKCLGLAWTSLSSEDWLKALRQEDWVNHRGIAVEPIEDSRALSAALISGPEQWMAIINPYGEVFPVRGPDDWKAALERIRSYVRRGGNWWETGGYSFYYAAYRKGGQWKQQQVGPKGMAALGLAVGDGDVEAAAESLRVTEVGRRWLGKKLAEQIERQLSLVNRGLPIGENAASHFALIAGEATHFIGGYSLGGWGRLWRIGGFRPNPEVAMPAVTKAIQYLFTHPPVPSTSGGIPYLWHAEFNWQ